MHTSRSTVNVSTVPEHRLVVRGRLVRHAPSSVAPIPFGAAGVVVAVVVVVVVSQKKIFALHCVSCRQICSVDCLLNPLPSRIARRGGESLRISSRVT